MSKPMQKNPKISIITGSKNTGRFIKETVDSILGQTYKNWEHIVIDVGSTDNSIDMIKSYSHIKWECYKENAVVETPRRALSMAKGDYIIQCCFSDGFLSKSWFKRCVEILDSDSEVSLVWGLPQYMSEEGDLLGVSYAEFFNNPPPQKEDFFPFWLATGLWFPEGNYCVRREVYDECFPENNNKDPFFLSPSYGFIYNFNTKGYLPYFLPIVANYGRIHLNSVGRRRYASIDKPIQDRYFAYKDSYKKKIFSGKAKHSFRDGYSSILKELNPAEVGVCRRKFLKHRFLNLPFMRYGLYEICSRLFFKGGGH